MRAALRQADIALRPQPPAPAGAASASEPAAAWYTSHMPRNVDHIAVEPRPDGRWARQRNGTKRAASLHDTQAEAEAAARAQAKRWRTELVVKGEDGRILRRESYGGDPARRPG
jgi:hypothetical protein